MFAGKLKPHPSPQTQVPIRENRSNRGAWRRTLQRHHQPVSGGDTTQGLPQTHVKEKRGKRGGGGRDGWTGTSASASIHGQRECNSGGQGLEEGQMGCRGFPGQRLSWGGGQASGDRAEVRVAPRATPSHTEDLLGWNTSASVSHKSKQLC